MSQVNGAGIESLAQISTGYTRNCETLAIDPGGLIVMRGELWVSRLIKDLNFVRITQNSDWSQPKE